MMIKDYKLLTELQHIHMEQIISNYEKVRCLLNISDYF